ncbi:F-box/LRR-repeat protein At5g02910-like isoform X1 [Rhododendron vialii]|uniref:F-box/LRR-repeat protein At5g02910-like isoform X1 n=1 Tax=Rhododendron vialii TaxID=182163 RepID=UPI00265EA19C|nr:F-box/LRR-repeat protein At5g02910-like isoform X1 [Rhododendron vialii]
MGSKRHRKKKMKLIGGEGEEEDRISRLPDSILHRILSSIDTTSFIPIFVQILSSIDTRSVIQTSVLSKRWRYLWTSVPNIHLDYDEFPGPNKCETKVRRFTHFVNQVLSLRDASNVLRFTLHSSSNVLDPVLVKNCICYAFRHNVRELFLWPECDVDLQHMEFPGCISEALGISSSSLISLRLACHDFSMPPDKPLQLPALKTLHLAGCWYDYAGFITETVGICTNLETLILDDLELKSLNITAPNLRKLELEYEDDSCSESMIAVSAPRLTSFKLQGNVLPVFSAASLPCLQNVHVNLYRGRIYEELDADILQRIPLNVMKMLEQLGEANSLTLSVETLEVLAMDPDSLNNRPSPFCKLKHLKFLPPYCPTLNLPLNAINYLTKGSSRGKLVVEFPQVIILLLFYSLLII